MPKSSSSKRQSPAEENGEKLETDIPMATTAKRRRTTNAATSTSSSSIIAATSDEGNGQPSHSSHVYDHGRWGTLFEDHLENKDNESIISFLAEQFIYFGLPISEFSNLTQFIRMMSIEYHENVYHNFTHACHVTLNCCYFLSKLSHPEDFSSVEKLALLFSAIIHDAGHLGVSNHALINKNHQLAKKYHDQSVAEMHSLTLGLEALQHGEHSLIQHFNSEEKRLFRKLMIELVLGTDIADPYKKKIAYDRVEELSNAVTGELPISLTSHDSKSILLVLILRASDVGSSMQSVYTSQLWAKNFYLETKFASLVGDAPHIEPSHCHATQINYFERHSQFLIKKLIRTNGIVDSFTTSLLHNVDENIQAWKKSGFELIREWDCEAVPSTWLSSAPTIQSILSSSETSQSSFKGKKQKKVTIVCPVGDQVNDVEHDESANEPKSKDKVVATKKKKNKSIDISSKDAETMVEKIDADKGRKGKPSRR
jgi:hypothetical protein